MKYSVLYIFILLPFFLTAQEFSVSGTVKDSNNKPIPYANVYITETSGTGINNSKGASSDSNGYYIIENLKSDNYIIKVSFLGFKTFSETISLQNNKVLNITLSEEAENLTEVEVIATKPTLKREADRLVFNIESTSLTEGSIWDVLRSTPGVLMINDEISVKNASNIIYLINEKRVYLSGVELQQLLSGSTANTVKSVEVITNPPAKYDAEGGAVINIQMSKNLITGYNGSLYGDYTQGIYPRFSVGTSHFYKNDKINIYAGYNFNANEVNRENIEDISFIQNSVQVGNWHTEIDRNTTSKNHTANLNFDYFIDSKNTFSISGNASLTPDWKRNTKSFTQAIDSTFSSINNTDDTKTNIALNADYIYKHSDASKLSFTAHHTNYDYDRFQDINTDYRNADNSFIRSNAFNTTSNQNVKINTAQADLEIQTKRGAFEMGIKASSINSKSNVNQLLTNNNTEVVDINNSGIFNYEESNFASYLSLNSAWEKWDLSIGIRGELTEGKGFLQSNSNQVNMFDYFKLFPKFNLTHTINENNSLGISYSKTIERPSYSDLNPFQFFLNDNAYVSGNPNLLPSITQTGTLSYSIKDTYTFEVYYRASDNPFSELSFQDNDANLIKYLASNLKTEVDYGFDFLTYTPITDNWSIYFVNSIFNDEVEFFDLENNNSIETNSKWSVYSNWINYFTFLKDKSLTANLSALYISAVIDGSAEVSANAQIDFGLKKSFSKGKWIATLSANDIFSTSGYTARNNYNSQKNSYIAKFDNQWIRFGLRYNFGNTKLKTNQKTKDLEERNRIKTNDN